MSTSIPVRCDRVRPGDMADHKSRTFDPRPVAEVNHAELAVRLRIGTVLTPWLRRRDYTYTREVWGMLTTRKVKSITPQQTQQTQLPPVSVASLALPPDEIVCACGETVTLGHTHPFPLDEPVNVPADPDVEPQPYDMPSPEADALDRIAEASLLPVGVLGVHGCAADFTFWVTVRSILRETGRL